MLARRAVSFEQFFPAGHREHSRVRFFKPSALLSLADVVPIFVLRDDAFGIGFAYSFKQPRSRCARCDPGIE
jgi:hypothetical protein